MGFAIAAYKTIAPENIGFSSFALFIGTALSVTAFPVLARILSDLNQHKTPIGVLALTCAAIDDATAWCLLALIVGILQSAIGGALYTIGLTALYVLAMIFVARPLIKKLIPWLERSSDHISEASFALVLIGLLISAVSTELIGIHALFGGFILGAIIPHERNIAKDLTLRLGDLVRVFFLPAFFAFTGLRTQIGLLSGANDWLICGALIALAIAGKFGGAFLAAKISGLTTRASAILGVLMNTRGLVGLIVLNAGLDLGVLTPRLFTMMVLMAVVTTVMTGPLLKLLLLPETEDANAKILLFRERS
jgi:Kef-type K+ transport system membrane component KefB